MAVLTSLAYARTRVRRGRTGQRVRLTATITATVNGGPFNLGHIFQPYGRTSQRSGQPYFAWSNFAVPIPFEHDTPISGTNTCSEPRFAWDSRRAVVAVINDNGTIVERISYDDALTFNSGVSRFSAASHPDVTAGRGGVLIELAYRASTIVGIRQTPAGATPSAEFTLKDSAGADLAVEDSVFRLIEDSRSWWWLHCRPSGAGTTRLLFSTDIDTGPTQTFATTSGAVTGIASGLHPGCCTSPGGTLYAWARVGTAGHITYRHPGSTAWATPVAMVDSTATALSFADQPFSITGVYESANRLVLAAIITGETAVSEWWSADERGISWTRLLP